MIKITSELKTTQGFKSCISILEITAYTLNETVQLVQSVNLPLPVSGKNINVQFSVYKSQADKNLGASPYQPIDFPYSFQLQPGIEDEVTESYIYNAVKAKLNDLGYNAEFV